MELTFKEWIDFEFPINEVIIGGSDYIQCKGYKGSDSPQDHPIGLEPRILKSDFTNSIHLQASNIHLAYCNINCEGLRAKRRRRFDKAIHSHDFFTFEGFSTGSPVSHEEYFQSLLKHKFCISPEGNGEDTHRHYESLLFKCIPIVQLPDDEYCLSRWNKKSTIRQKYSSLPVLYTKNYESLTESYLLNQYELMLDKKFNFSKLLKSYWVKTSKDLECNSNFWLKNFKNEEWI